MKQASLIFQYHDRSYDLVKYAQCEAAYWCVYSYNIHGRGLKVAQFNDVKFNYEQAEHVAKHLLRMWQLGKDAGREEVKEELRNLVDRDVT